MSKVPPSEGRDFRKSFSQKLKEKVIEVGKAFKKDKAGLAGLVILVLLGIYAASTLALTEKQGLYQGKGPKYAAPIWLAPFDNHKFKFDKTLVKTDFSEKAALKKFEGPKVEPKTSEHIATKTSISDSAFVSEFRDKKKPTNKTVTRSVVLSKDVPWEKRPPNGLAFSYSFQFSLSGDLTYKFFKNNTYSTSIGVYIHSESFPTTDSLIGYLRSRGVSLSNISYTKYGLKFAAPKFPVGTFEPRRLSGFRLPRRKLIKLFDVLPDLKFNFVTKFSLLQPNATRPSGTISASIKKVKMVARGYYSGLMGTTDVGSDLFVLMAQAIKNSLIIGLSVTTVTLFIGISLGLIAGWYGGRIEQIIMRVVDFLMVLPVLPLALVLVSVFNQMEVNRVWGVMMTLSLVSWAGIARLIRSQVLSVKERPFIEAAEASGAYDRHIMLGHILPNIMGLVIYQVVLSVQSAILMTAALSFLQMGPKWVSFGNLLQRVTGVLLGIGPTGGSTGPVGGGGETQTGAKAVMSAWWFLFFPGFTLFIFGTALVFVGMTLQKMIQGRTQRVV